PTPHAMFTLELRCHTHQMRHDVRLDSFDIVRMDTVEPFVGSALQFVAFTTEHRLPSRAEMHRVCFKIPLPQAIACAAEQHRAALFARVQRFEGLLALGHRLLELETLSPEF